MKLAKIISQKLSLKLSLMVVFAIALLLAVSLAVLFHFSRQVLKKEAMRNAEMTLEGTAQQIDNILLSVEQSAGNIYWDMLAHLNEPERMNSYSHRLVECNPYLVGCAIVFKPHYFPGQELSMFYVHKKDFKLDAKEIVTKQTFSTKPYTEQEWYKYPMETGRAYWTNPLKDLDTEGEEIISFCLPIYDKTMQCVGVLAADVPIRLLSNLVLAVKPSQHAYSTLLARNGSYIVHPDSAKLLHHTVYDLMKLGADHTLIEATESMLAGETGMKPLEIDGERWYVFYKPFKRAEVTGRSMDDLNWSVGVVYPEDDVFGDYNNLLYYVLAIAIIGLLLLFIICRNVIYRQLQPLLLLTRTAQRITEGNYKETIPETKREDEIGQLQQHFGLMQQSLASQVSELEHLSETLEERGEVLQKAYKQAQEADRMKTAFLHNMTNQMLIPSETIRQSVQNLCQDLQNISTEEALHEEETIQEQGTTIIQLINNMIKSAENETLDTGKEASYE